MMEGGPKIPSEMEVALRYKLLTLQYVAKAAPTAALFTLLALFLHCFLFHCFITVYTVTYQRMYIAACVGR